MSFREAVRRRAWPVVSGIVAVWALLALATVLLLPQGLGGSVEYLVVSGTSMEPAMHTGDLTLVRRSATYRTGEAVAFRIPAGEPGAGAVVIHRIIGGSASDGYLTRGDNRDYVDLWRPRASDIVGKRWALVPRGGLLVARLRSPVLLGLLAAAATLVVVARPSRT